MNWSFLNGLAFVVSGLILAAIGYLDPIIAGILYNVGSCW